MEENYSKLADIAYNLHVSGKLEEAKFVYEKILEINPHDINILNLYAQLSFSLKNYDKALEIFDIVYEKTKLDDILINISRVYLCREEYEKAACALDKAKIKSDSVYRLFGLIYMKQNKYTEAIESYLKIEKTDFLDLYNLSTAYLQNNDKNSALKYALEAFQRNKTDINLINRIAVLYKEAGNDEKAVEFFNNILEIDSKNKNALQNIAAIYKNYDKNVSVQILNDLSAMYPDDTSILNSLYVIYNAMMNHTDAYKIALKLIDLQPDESCNYTFAADSLLELYKYNDALEMYKKALGKCNDDEYINLQIAYIYFILGKTDDAVKILKKYPQSDIAKKHYTYLYCKEKNFSEVKEDFFDCFSFIKSTEEIVKKAKSLFYKLNLNKKYSVTEQEFVNSKKTINNFPLAKVSGYMKKAWKNNDINAKRLLVYSANGAGDIIMCCRFLNKIAKSASEIIVQLPDSLVDLFKYNFPNIKVYSEQETISDEKYDYTSSFMCLLYCVNVNFNNLCGNPYLKISEKKINEKSQLDIIKTEKKKIGLFWQGTPNIYMSRSIKLEKFIPLLELKNTCFYSFQISKVDIESEILKHTLDLIDLAPLIKNYADTAAFLKNMDILITIDSSIAHLAGALGVKTFLLLPFDSEWRWFYDTETTPWYDSIKIFKQKIPADWDEVIQRVKNELEL